MKRDNSFSVPTHIAQAGAGVDFQKWAKDMGGSAPSEEEVRRAEASFRSGIRAANLTESGVRDAITSDDFERLVLGNDLLETSALEACQRWVHARSSSAKTPLAVIVLAGATGRGKTVAGAWLLAQVGGRYITAEDLRRLYVSKDWRDKKELEKLRGARCVVVDDAGTEDGPSVETSMWSFVNHRASSTCWTLITANLTEAEFRLRYDERTIRRIEHQGWIIEVDGEDLRRRPR